MMRTGLFVALLITLISSSGMSGCRKGGTCKAGTGGNVTLKLSPQHHGVPVCGTANYHDSLFIKFNSPDFPGPAPSNYDLVIGGNTGDAFVNVSGLKCGQYYVFMTGFDTSSWHIRVAGGIPIDFSETTGSQNIIVPVTE